MIEYSAEAAGRAAAAIRNLRDAQPSIGIVLGSGLGGLAKKIADAVRIPFGDIPGFPEATVVGHEGAVIVGTLGGRDVVALSGRFHVYEGHPASLAAFPVRVFRALGARDLFVSNAAGGISQKLAVGDLMLISDHLNLMASNPLVGELQEGDTRFPDMTDAYDPGFRRILRTTAEKHGIVLREGVYAGLLGPSYETPSEVKMLRLLGADAAAGVTGAALSHAEVLETTNKLSEAFESLVTEFLERTATSQLSPAR
jgi:purine-nucleoside phosphorylase